MNSGEMVNKETMKTIFSQIQKNRISAASDEAVFQELCWILTLQPRDVNAVFDDFIPSSQYNMSKEEYAEICEDEDLKNNLPTLEEINEKRRENMVWSIVEGLALRVPNVIIAEQ